MKESELKKKIIRNFTITGILFVGLCSVLYITNYQKNLAESKISSIDNEIAKIKENYRDLQSKSADIKKYISMWENIDDTHKLISGIKLDEVNTILAKIAEKYFITDYQIKVSSIPQVLEDGIFKCKTVTVIFTKASLTFSAVNDVKTMLFIDELFSKIPGYGIIEEVEIKKAKDYTTEDLVRVSSGKNGNISGKIDFIWYGYRQKESSTDNDNKLPTDNNNAGNAKQ